MLTLIGSQTSPFVRFVRVILEELELPYQLEETTFFAAAGAEQDALIQKTNPLMKVPALIDGDQSILDSRIIVDYLLKKHPNKTRDLQQNHSSDIASDNWLTIILGIIDAGVLRFIMQNMHPQIDMNSGYLNRSRERMMSGLAYLNEQSQLGQNFTTPAIALICGLEWFARRDICSWKEFPQLVHIHEAYSERPSFVKTRIPNAG